MRAVCYCILSRFFVYIQARSCAIETSSPRSSHYIFWIFLRDIDIDTDSDEVVADGSESGSQEIDAAALTWTLSSYEKSESASRGASEQTV